jgi:two-component system nitrogen regulation response regulator GlnG/two-component system response regulator HydG
MPERTGLIGGADGSTLFLDEIGELSHALQAHLLRVVDGGEYHRLGEAKARRADVRIVAATNRDPNALKHDLLARLRLRIRLPGLDKRREDIPLITRHLLRQLAQRDPMVAERVFPDGDARGEPAWTAGFVAGLITAAYPTNVRELQMRLWEAIGRETGDGLTLDDELPPRVDDDDTSVEGGVDPTSVTAEQVVAALDAAGGSRDRAWRALGLRSRHQLLRIMRRFGIGRAQELGQPVS